MPSSSPIFYRSARIWRFSLTSSTSCAREPTQREKTRWRGVAVRALLLASLALARDLRRRRTGSRLSRTRPAEPLAGIPTRAARE